MWRTGIAAVVLLALTGCGDSGDDGEAVETVSVTVAPTEAQTEAEESAIGDACSRILELAPDSYPGRRWRDVLAEATFLATSEDAEVRDAARDLADAVEPIVTAWEDGASANDWDRITTRFGENWQAFRDEWCSGT